MVEAIVRLRSTFMLITCPFAALRSSLINSNQVPRPGINSDKNVSLPVLSSISDLKYAPGERTICDTITRSAPFIINVPVSVIKGRSPKKTSSSFSITSPVCLLITSSRMIARNGAA